MQKPVLITLLLIVYSFVVADCGAQSYNFKNYSVEEGLNQAQIMDVEEDHLGNLWIATAGAGVFQFDGKNFEALRGNLSSYFIYDLYFDSNQNLWIRTSKSISRYDGQNIKNFEIRDFSEYIHSINDVIELDSGIILAAAANGGLIKIENDELSIWNEASGFGSPLFATIKRYDEARVIAISINDGYYLIDKNNPETIQKIDYPDKIKPSRIYDILFQEDEVVFATANGLYAFCENSVDGSFEFNGKYYDQYCTKVVEDRNGTIYCVGRKGLVILEDGTVSEVNGKNGLTDFLLNDLFLDSKENLWIASNGAGLYRYLGDQFKYLNENNGLSDNQVLSILGDSAGNVWFGTNTGLSYLDRSSGEITTSVFADETLISTLCYDDRRSLWVGAKDAVIKIEASGTQTHYALEPEVGYVSPKTSLFCPKKGVWIGTNHGLYLFDERGYKRFTTKDGLLSNYVNFLYQWSENKILICSEGGLNIMEDGEIKECGNLSFLNEKSILSLTRQKNYIWFTESGKGLGRYHTKSKTIEYFSENDGLISDLVYSLSTDVDSNVWVGTAKGLNSIALAEDFVSPEFSYFGKSEGFTGIETNRNAVYHMPDGSIWFGTIKGAYRYDPHKDPVKTYDPGLYVKSVNLFYGDEDIYPYADRVNQWRGIPENLRLPHNKNHLTFEFWSTHLSAPEYVRYSFKLEGFDKFWSPVTKKNFATYANLPPGNYEFKVMVINEDGGSSREPLAYPFVINSPFWTTWWFTSGLFIMVVIVFLLVQRYIIHQRINRELQLQKLKRAEADKIKKNLAMDFHDELGNELANILTYSNLLKFKFEKADHKTLKALYNLSDSAEKLLKGTKEFIWSIDPKNDNLFEVLSYLKDFGEDLFADTDTRFMVQRDILNVDNNIKLPSGWSRQILFIFKEAMTNAFKHAGAHSVHFDTIVDKNQIRISLKDDGRGLNEKGLGYGLANMSTRAQKMRSNIEIKNGQGTEILLHLKIPKKRGYKNSVVNV
jgi:ligand-binding sensor domain-containing protein/signal transduction histidine kinase